MSDTPGHDPSSAWREVRLQAGPDARPASGPSTRTVRIRRIRGERATAATGLDGSWLTGRAAETLVSGGRVPSADAEAARTADRLADLLAVAGPRHGAGAAALDPAREEAALAAFRAARSAAPKGRARPLARCFGGPRRPRPPCARSGWPPPRWPRCSPSAASPWRSPRAAARSPRPAAAPERRR